MVVGDTKAGTLIGTDRYGNKYYEDTEELPRTCHPMIVAWACYYYGTD